MASKKPPIHGRDHLPGGADPIPAAAAATGTEQSASPVVVPVLSPMPSYAANSGSFQYAKPSAASPTGGIFSNRYDSSGGAATPANGDYYTWPVNLGPKGSIWALHVHTLQGPDCGIWKPSMATAVAPNPFRTPPDDLGTIENYNAGSFRTTAGLTFNDYHATQIQSFGTQAMEFRIMGDPGDQWTANLGLDPGGSSATEINGGPGPYLLKIAVTGKSGSSSGYAIDIVAITFWRLDDIGVL